MHSVRYGTQTITYEIVRKPKLKNTYISVDREGVQVRTNDKVTEREIESYVLKKSAWIVKHLQAYKTKAEQEAIRTGSRLYYLGKSYYVQLLKENRRDIAVEFIHSKFIIKTPEKVSQSALAQAIDLFYKERAHLKILPLVKKWSKEMELHPSHISFRKASKRWGSCSHTNRISFNYHLMKLPTQCIEYVVVHELAHIQHKNHSVEFWSFVERYMPNYPEMKKRIKEYEKLI